MFNKKLIPINDELLYYHDGKNARLAITQFLSTTNLNSSRI